MIAGRSADICEPGEGKLVSFRYVAFGLHLISQRTLSGLRPSSGSAKADVEVSWRTENAVEPAFIACAPPGPAITPLPGLYFRKAQDGSWHQLHYENGLDFILTGQADHVSVYVPPGLSDTTTAGYLLGPVLGYVLRLRRMLCLHASATVVGGRVLAFVGPAGSGKSALAAAFAMAGYPILTDDKVAITVNGQALIAHPGEARLRLRPDVADLLLDGHTDLPRLLPEDPTCDKRYVDLDQLPGGFAAEPLPLAALFILGARATDSQQVGIRPVHPHPALVGLAANTYMNYLADRSSRGWEFDALAKVVTWVPTFLVTPSAHLHDVTSLCQAILTVGAPLATERPAPTQLDAL